MDTGWLLFFITWSLILFLGSWRAVLYVGFPETGPKWLVPLSFTIMILSGLILTGLLFYGMAVGT